LGFWGVRTSTDAVETGNLDISDDRDAGVQEICSSRSLLALLLGLVVCTHLVMMSLACKNLNAIMEEICSSRSSNCSWVWRFAHAGDDELGMKNLNVNVLFFKRFAAAKA
jgi:hypothetical protein